MQQPSPASKLVGTLSTPGSGLVSTKGKIKVGSTKHIVSRALTANSNFGTMMQSEAAQKGFGGNNSSSSGLNSNKYQIGFKSTKQKDGERN
jgi:hypothetical protein